MNPFIKLYVHIIYIIKNKQMNFKNNVKNIYIYIYQLNKMCLFQGFQCAWELKSQNPGFSAALWVSFPFVKFFWFCQAAGMTKIPVSGLCLTSFLFVFLYGDTEKAKLALCCKPLFPPFTIYLVYIKVMVSLYSLKKSIV